MKANLFFIAAILKKITRPRSGTRRGRVRKKEAGENSSYSYKKNDNNKMKL